MIPAGSARTRLIPTGSGISLAAEMADYLG